MIRSTDNLILAPDAAIDLQTHTILSDGKWTPDALIDHAAAEGFSMIAITDHDRPDTAPAIQRAAAERGLPVLVAVELTTTWRGEYTDILCYGYDHTAAPLLAVCADLLRRQQENTAETCQTLRQRGVELLDADIAEICALPGSRQATAMVAMLQRLGYNDAGTRVREAGASFLTINIIDAVEAGHAAGGVCIVAHPGRGVEFTKYDAALLDELRLTVPIDGIEAYYPRHSAEQTAAFLDYAARNKLLVSAGSDSHGPNRPPIKYPAEHCRALLERVGVTVR